MLAVAMSVAIRRYLANSIAHRWCTAHTSLFTQRPQVFVLTGLGDNKRSCCLFFLYKSAINFQHKFKREEFVNSLDTERPAIQENIRLLGLKRSCAKAVVFNFSHQVVLWSYRSNLGLLACFFFFFFFFSFPPRCWSRKKPNTSLWLCLLGLFNLGFLHHHRYL